MDGDRWDKVFAAVEQAAVILGFLVFCGMFIGVCIENALR